MKKTTINLLMCIILIATLLAIGGCNKKTDNTSNIINDVNHTLLDDSVVIWVYPDELQNEKLKEIIEDRNEKLKPGVYSYIDNNEGNYYILFNGINFWYSNISLNIEYRLLTINCNTTLEKGLRIKYLFLINPIKLDTFDKIELINNGNVETLYSLSLD